MWLPPLSSEFQPLNNATDLASEAILKLDHEKTGNWVKPIEVDMQLDQIRSASVHKGRRFDDMSY